MLVTIFKYSVVPFSVGSLFLYGCQNISRAYLDRYNPQVAAPKQHKIILDNDKVRVYEVICNPGEVIPHHMHSNPAIIITEENARVKITNHKEEVVYTGSGHSGATWVPPSKYPLSTKNIDTKRFKIYRIEIKD